MSSVRRILSLSLLTGALSIAGCGGGGGGGSSEAPGGVPTPPVTGSGSWTVHIAWDASSASGVYGYRLYSGGSATALSASGGLLTSTSVDVPIASAGTYYFAVSAVDVNNAESSLSTPVSVDVH